LRKKNGVVFKLT